MAKVSIEAAAKSRRSLYVRSGKLELKLATEFLHDNCDSWNEDCENTFRLLLDKAAMYIAKAEALDELLKLAEESNS